MHHNNYFLENYAYMKSSLASISAVFYFLFFII